MDLQQHIFHSNPSDCFSPGDWQSNSQPLQNLAESDWHNETTAGNGFEPLTNGASHSSGTMSVDTHINNGDFDYDFGLDTSVYVDPWEQLAKDLERLDEAMASVADDTTVKPRETPPAQDQALSTSQSRQQLQNRTQKRTITLLPKPRSQYPALARTSTMTFASQSLLMDGYTEQDTPGTSAIMFKSDSTQKALLGRNQKKRRLKDDAIPAIDRREPLIRSVKGVPPNSCFTFALKSNSRPTGTTSKRAGHTCLRCHEQKIKVSAADRTRVLLVWS